MKNTLSIILSLLVSPLCFGSVLSFKVDADRSDCLYRCGETAKISVTAVDTNGIAVKSGKVSVVFDNFGDRKVSPDRVVDLGKENPFTVNGSRTTPGFLRLTLKPFDKDVVGLGNRGYNGKPRVNEPYYYGVGFEPERIEAGTPNPPDFDAFWADAIRNLEETVPLDPQVEPITEGAPEGFNLFRVSFATCGGRRVYGWLVEPKDLSRGPFRGKVEVPGAGLGATVPTGAEPDTVRLLINVHTYPQPEAKDAAGRVDLKTPYERQKEKWAKPFGVKDYYLGGIHLGREQYFYYAAILGINRAIDWLATRPSCDPSRISYRGTSQGGGFGLYLTALNKHISRSCIFVPALTDLLGSKIEGRESGWPRLIEEQLPENRAAAEKWAPYFCGVNFARRITCPIRFVVGFADTVCPPHAGYAAYNVCPSKDKKIINGIAMFHAVYGEFYSRLGSWQNEDARVFAPIDPTTVWNRAELYKTPKTWAFQRTFQSEVTPIWIEGEPYHGKPTRLFAFYGVPEGANATNKVPAIVLVHGGAGTAYPEWVRLWVRRGYAAISVDTCGQLPVQVDGGWMASPYGGPRGWGGIEQQGEALRDQWTYHAVAAAMRSHSFLRSLEGVDTRHVGVTGISWGGFLTCIVAAADDRFAYAVPVYGSGFFYECDVLAKNHKGDLLSWGATWDPCVFLPFARIPFLWVDGTNDFAFSLDRVKRSAALLKAPSFFCTRVRMPHAHGPAGEAPAEILDFADHFARGGRDVVHFGKVERRGEGLSVTYDAKGRTLARAELNWTEDGDDVHWHKRLWKTRRLETFDSEKGEVSAAPPKGTKQAIFNLIADDGLIFSSPLYEAK